MSRSLTSERSDHRAIDSLGVGVGEYQTYSLGIFPDGLPQSRLPCCEEQSYEFFPRRVPGVHLGT